ncbi:MAG: hypothetical protein DSY90_00630 [Deltaproteobacteria bacterium]|nr:MAG: hypothetical protein DSY90_00630 [Deltaproteobacteria bacterium]RUA02977.1 MAG: hypothetical protein DSY89_01820 [Deltaproteobacteria bacterium]
MKKLLSKWLLGNIAEKYTTNAPFGKVFETLTEVVKDYDFNVVAVHDLKETFKKKNLPIPNDFEYRIVQICNAEKSHRALTKMSFDMGIMMPKSIIIAQKNGQTSLRFMKMKPWMVGLMFPEINIAPMSKMVMKTITEIVKETIKKVK